ncbi:hypothetical protein BKA62DRAFT_723357 [Auriculariales sp. MPI-PUGE-AT-0066]|nr:hypothetical protein BKA62DRAFT_723357 [Auriculariales sp. MPI-PUGE-AT-0066]
MAQIYQQIHGGSCFAILVNDLMPRVAGFFAPATANPPWIESMEREPTWPYIEHFLKIVPRKWWMAMLLTYAADDTGHWSPPCLLNAHTHRHIRRLYLPRESALTVASVLMMIPTLELLRLHAITDDINESLPLDLPRLVRLVWTRSSAEDATDSQLLASIVSSSIASLRSLTMPVCSGRATSVLRTHRNVIAHLSLRAASKAQVNGPKKWLSLKPADQKVNRKAMVAIINLGPILSALALTLHSLGVDSHSEDGEAHLNRLVKMMQSKHHAVVGLRVLALTMKEPRHLQDVCLARRIRVVDVQYFPAIIKSWIV